MPSTRRGAILTLPTLLALLLPSYLYIAGDSTVRISSTPAGAFIFLDGEDTGKTTPAMLELGSYVNLGGLAGGDRTVTIRKKGYEPEQRILHHHSSIYHSRWVDGATPFLFLTAPLFWTMGDLLLPASVHWTYVPNELHVTLYAVP